MKSRHLSILLTILLTVSWIWFAYEDNKPKTSVDLVNYISVNEDGELQDVILNDSSLESTDIENHVNYFQHSTQVSQFFIVKADHEDNSLLVETTPGLNSNKLHIKDIKEIDANALQEMLAE
ncbi:hypothetical protein [Halalkalibacillus halophilus]|uniref:hypothetical protein n=1 Tax=Halalkalibacillus halophilus TaxID=392827 RepID=UPI00041CB6E8|nr:hypothetical protein [Halalkalibacillus halophilus]